MTVKLDIGAAVLDILTEKLDTVTKVLAPVTANLDMATVNLSPVTVILAGVTVKLDLVTVIVKRNFVQQTPVPRDVTGLPVRQGRTCARQSNTFATVFSAVEVYWWQKSLPAFLPKSLCAGVLIQDHFPPWCTSAEKNFKAASSKEHFTGLLPLAGIGLVFLIQAGVFRVT